MTSDTPYGEFPLRQFLGMGVRTLEAGRAVASVDISEAHLNPNGVVHGAVLFALADTAMGAAAMSVLSDGQYATSVDVQLRFVRPASAGRLEASVEVLKRGRHVIHLDGRVVGDEGQVIATASGTFTTFTV
ncbi:MAG: PaaI family thioesterase [Microthrixaceae bacterium]